MSSRRHLRVASRRGAMRAVAGAVIVAALTAVAPAAGADPPHGDGGHTHHVTTGNGGCVDVNAVVFLPENRGLHRGANASGSDRGPWHGPC